MENRFRSRLLVVLGVAAAAHAQGPLRCDLEMKSTPGAGAGAACLDIVALQAGGAPLQAPANATRIGRDGFNLCKNAFAVETGGRADIVFVFDNSGSMMAKAAYIDPIGGDTLFYYLDGNRNACGSNPLAGSLIYATSAGPRTVSLLQTNADCATSLSGDAYSARGAVIQAAIDYIAQTSPGSTAGVVGFTTVTSNPQPPLPMDVPANVVQAKSRVILDTTGGTYYRPPLRLAKEWLNDPSLTKTAKQAIVFISDGAPNDSYLSLVDAGMPPIHSIYLSRSITADTAALRELSARTGGTFTRVNPNKVEEIGKVMQNIIRSLLISVVPPSIVITNNSFAPAQVSRSSRLSMNPDSSVSVVLDSILALKLGANDLQVRIVLSDTSSRTFNVKVQADGPLAPGSNSQVTCYPAPTLAMLNPAGFPDAAYPAGPARYTVRLNRSSSDLAVVLVSAVSADSTKPKPWGDAETITLQISTAGPPAVYQLGGYPVRGDDRNPITGNSILTSDRTGKIILGWVHPRDPREFANYELPGIGPPTPIPPILVLQRHNDIAEQGGAAISDGKSWVLVGKAGLVLEGATAGTGCCRMVDAPLAPGDTGSYVGIKVQANGPFAVEAKVFSTLGTFVNTVSFNVSQAEYEKLPLQAGDSSRVLMMLWNGRTQDGKPAGTGAFIMRSVVSLVKGGQRIVDSRIVGVLRRQ